MARLLIGAVLLFLLYVIGAVIWGAGKTLYDALRKRFNQLTDKLFEDEIREKQRRLQEEKAVMQRQADEQKRLREADAKQKAEEQRLQHEELKKQVLAAGERELLFNEQINPYLKIRLLQECFNYSHSDAEELLETAQKEAKRARLQKAKKGISRKAFELYGGLPSDDARIAIPDEIKQYVWQRDGGHCVKCNSNENLEFDHIIPVSKGGSNTARNIQIYCHKTGGVLNSTA